MNECVWCERRLDLHDFRQLAACACMAKPGLRERAERAYEADPSDYGLAVRRGILEAGLAVKRGSTS